MPDRAEKGLKKVNYTGTGAISVSIPAPSGQKWRYVGLTLHLSGVPDPQTLSVTLNSAAGAAYDTLLNSSLVSAANLVLPAIAPATGAFDVLMISGDAIDIAYATPVGITYGLEVTFEVI